MKEIKFRAWDKERKEWQYFTLLQLIQGQTGLFWSKLENWCHFSSFKDKKSKEIYEGDIVKGKWKESIEAPNPEIVEVCPLISESYHWYSELEDRETEVIGNIYENPKLLK